MQFYETNLSCEAIRVEHSDQTIDFFNQVANQIITTFSPESVLDVGSSNGLLVAALKKAGVKATAADPLDLTPTSTQQYDLITCIEVLQCLSPAISELVIKAMCSLTDQVFITSNPDRFTEANHINIRPVEDWAALFVRYGFTRDLTIDSAIVSSWATIYRRTKVDASALVRSYESILTRRDQEIRQLRVLNQNLQEQNQHGHAVARDPELLYRENLRLRDSLAGAEAARDESLAKERAANDELLRFRIAAGRLERIERSLPWRIMKPFRALRNRLGHLKNQSN